MPMTFIRDTCRAHTTSPRKQRTLRRPYRLQRHRPHQRLLCMITMLRSARRVEHDFRRFLHKQVFTMFSTQIVWPLVQNDFRDKLLPHTGCNLRSPLRPLQTALFEISQSGAIPLYTIYTTTKTATCRNPLTISKTSTCHKFYRYIRQPSV